MKELERRGIPTVALVSDDFVHDHRRTADSFGIPQLPLAQLAAPLTGQTPATIHGLIDRAIDDVVRGLLTVPEKPGAAAAADILMVRDSWLSFEGPDLLEAAAEMNRQFLEWQYGDGFPLVPATRASLERMLAGTTRDRDEVVGLLEPGVGAATVEKIAINAVMAGCRPRHLPIVLAAVECLADFHMNLREKAISTGPAAPMLVVNGPAREYAGLNRGICMLGPGAPSHANTAIGRAVRLCMMNIGHTYPAISDMDTIGSPNKYSMCLAENEEHSPWEPYHVSRGAEPGESSVTVGFVYGLVDLSDYQSNSLVPEKAIEKYATAAKYMCITSTGYWLVGHRSNPAHGNREKENHYLLLCPQHAKLFAEAGWSRRDVQEALHRSARLPFGYLSSKLEAAAIRTAHPELDWLWDSPGAEVPILEDPDCYRIIVSGSAGSNRSAFSWGMGAAHTKPILAADLELDP